jgi:hypothetical protein
MIRQYDLLNRCLKELRSASFPAMGKLKLELQFIQVKKILLDWEVEYRLRGNAESERQFLGLYEQVRQICSSSYVESEAEKLILCLDKIKAASQFTGALHADTIPTTIAPERRLFGMRQ